jgi:hypothetical protein
VYRGGNEGDLPVRRVDGRRGFHARLPPGEVLPRLQDRLHLRGHFQHPAQHYREVPQAGVLVNINKCLKKVPYLHKKSKQRHIYTNEIKFAAPSLTPSAICMFRIFF